MSIKKFCMFLIMVVSTLGLISSCSSFRNDILKQDDESIATKNFDAIIDSLKSGDKEAIKDMFSPNALKEANDIDGGIEYLMNFFKGNIESTTRGINVSASNDHGKKKNQLACMTIVTTDVDTYIVFFIDKLVDTETPDNEGLYMIQIIKESDREKEFDWGGENTLCAGIYRSDIWDNK